MAGAATNHRAQEDARQKAIGGILRGCVCATAIGFFTALSVLAVAAVVDDLAQLQQRFDLEKDGVRKAKLMQKLGDAQFKKEREAAAANDYVTVGLVMESYRDNVRAALNALKKSRPDAEKHSGGYRELEFHTALGIREIRDVILAIPEQYRPPMQLVESDLKDMDMEMLKLLFPRRPGEKPPLDQRQPDSKKAETPPERLP